MPCHTNTPNATQSRGDHPSRDQPLYSTNAAGYPRPAPLRPSRPVPQPICAYSSRERPTRSTGTVREPMQAPPRQPRIVFQPTAAQPPNERPLNSTGAAEEPLLVPHRPSPTAPQPTAARPSRGPPSSSTNSAQNLQHAPPEYGTTAVDWNERGPMNNVWDALYAERDATRAAEKAAFRARWAARFQLLHPTRLLKRFAGISSPEWSEVPLLSAGSLAGLLPEIRVGEAFGEEFGDG
ncbi:uncharacterized protein BDZ99DRAFT_495179 [Mytilinidion resinicola]|uniref:Uncharacterized protein n=1 Tax=Mytilinidion resinicola TaxID=574789 RepID=A0A6A6Z437_9PEZI|nr:uncharacterized protein BDZ99DRAFT_495179 [Mytilinidion resinicola]KAF2815413.1 hypothetical protein BDZ99DRAFT_495179 [Mytilinidion resinicola]